MKKFIALFFSLFMLGITVPLEGQELGKKNDLLTCIDRYYGSNDLLINGRPYIPTNTKATGHPYWGNGVFLPGTLFIKSQQFENVDLKLNLEKDKLILQQELTNGIPVKYIATTSLVDSFHIDNRIFVNTHSISNEIGEAGFIQQLYVGKKIGFYRKQIKYYLPNLSSIHPFGRYSDPDKKYYLTTEDGLFELNSKKAFLDFFGTQKKAVKQYMKQQSIQFKKATDAQFYNLLKYCDELQ